MQLDHFPTRKSGNDGVYATFYIDAVRQGFKSEEAGRDIWEDREFIRIFVGGDNKNIIEREAHVGDQQRFPQEYRLFKEGLKDVEQVVGTPLSQWPVMTPSTIRMLNAQNIFVVEQLRDMSDTAIQAVGMGARELKLKAGAYLEHAKDSSAATRLAAENQRLLDEVTELKRQVAEIAARVPVARDDEQERRGPGRPRKAA